MDAAGARALIDQMRQELQLIVDQVVAQGDHIPNFRQFGIQQEAVIGAFADTSKHMLQHAETVHETWTDVAGDTYTWALRESSNSVGEFSEIVRSANVPAELAEANSQISTAIIEVLSIQTRFEAKATQVLTLIALYESLAALANPTPAQVAELQELATRITAGLTELRRLVDTAGLLRDGLSDGLARIGSRLSSSASDAGAHQWYGPQGAGAPAGGSAATAPGPAAVGGGPMSASNAAPLGDSGAAAATDPAAAGASAAGAGGAGGGAAAAGGSGAGAAGGAAAAGAGGAGGGAGMGGGGQIPPIAPIGAGGAAGVGGGNSNRGIVPGAGVNPLPSQVPEIAAGLGSDGAKFPGVAGVPFAPIAAGAAIGGGKPVGIPPGLHSPPIAKAGPSGTRDIPGLAPIGTGADDGVSTASFDPAAGVGTPGAGGDAGGPGRGTPMMPPPPMAPMGGAGAGGGGSPGDGKGPGSPERRRPARNVPGVPKRLRGRAGTLDSTPAFMATPASAVRTSEDEAATVEVLDERLWQVEETPVDKKFATDLGPR